MNHTLSLNTQAILLLTAPLIVGRSKRSTDLLTHGEYKKLAAHLRGIEAEPAELIKANAGKIFDECHQIIDKTRLARLCERGVLLSQALIYWEKRAIWVVSRADKAYPRRLKKRLGVETPALLYGCGEQEILNNGGLAVVGSRKIDAAMTEYTHRIGCLTADANYALISGGAKGVDQTAMRAALEQGGTVAGVLADRLEKNTLNRDNRNRLLRHQLVLISPYDPNASFSVGQAMQRNKLIYALADAALVVNADLNRGGTWCGAIEQLQKLNFVPVYVRSTGAASEGLEGLKKRGAIAWPDAIDATNFSKIFQAVAQSTAAALPEPRAAKHQEIATGQQEYAAADNLLPTPESTGISPAEQLYQKYRALVMRICNIPRKPAEVAKALNMTPTQTSKWLARLVAENVLEKQLKPIGYVVREPQSPAEQLYEKYRALVVCICRDPRKPTEVAEELNILPAQSERWLEQLVEARVLEKHLNPLGYVTRTADNPADELYREYRALIMRMCNTPIKSTKIAEGLDIMPTQAEKWLKQLVDANALEKSTRPVQYVIKTSDLFDAKSSR